MMDAISADFDVDRLTLVSLLLAARGLLGVDLGRSADALPPAVRLGASR
jgi:hypothetical protein